MDIHILPADTYIVTSKSVITEEDKKVLNMLYLPIIGPLPIMLYNMFLLDMGKLDISKELTHAHLLSTLKVSNQELTEARNSLEAIGLLKTYLKKDVVNNYLYELYSPVSAYEFFSHPMFNMILYSNVGKVEYDTLVNVFKASRINKDEYEEVTHTFNKVFKSIPNTSYDVVSEGIRKKNKLNLSFDTDFDIDFLIETIGNNIDKKIFTKDLKELIIKLAYLYDIDPIKMQDYVKSCINEKGTVNREELRKVVRNHYQFDHGGILPTVVEHTQPEYLRKPIGENSNLAKMIYTFETTSPYDFLKSKHNGNEPPKRDMELLEDLIIDQGLKPGVVNVLVDYTLKTNENRLNRKFVEAIAGQWSRSKIETVEEAMNIARKNHRKVSKTINVDKGKVNEPVWFNKENTIDLATDEERKNMDDLLKEYK